MWIAVAMVTAPAALVAATPPTVDFTSQIQPILVEHCARCHGFDDATRQGGLRLDVRDAAVAGGDSGRPAVAPGDPAGSEVIRRLRSHDPDESMPPPGESNPVAAEDLALLEAWIAQGAGYARHWAFVPPQAVMPPTVAGAGHAIDAFVVERLTRLGLRASPPADDATLCRRLHLDLVGLPAGPADLDAFARDGYDATVDALLASPRFGERWAAPWLDLARYSDTNGYEKDLPREMWVWRDWVITALNDDMPYDRFIVEQIAGDMLPEATSAQLVATGFLRNSMLNEEGAIIPEEFRMAEMFDRLDCLGKAVLGLTIGCAQCHTHKFDPLTHEDYYGLFAFLNDTYEAHSDVFDPAGQNRLAEIRRQVATLEAGIRRERPHWAAESSAWERRVADALIPWAPVVMDDMSSGNLLTHPTQLLDRSILMLGHRDEVVVFEATPDLRGATGLRLEALTHGDLRMCGPGRDGPWAVAELVVEIKPPAAETWRRLTLVDATADFSSPERTLAKKVIRDGAPAEDVLRAGPVEFLIDGDDRTAWEADRGPLLRHQPAAAAVSFQGPLDPPAGTRLRISLRHLAAQADFNHPHTTALGCCRVSLTRSPCPAVPPVDHAAVLAMATPAAERDASATAAVFTAWRKAVPALRSVDGEIAALWRQAPAPLTTVFHLAARPPGNHRPTRLLDRGAWDKPLHEVASRVPAALHPFPDHAPGNRAGFARWLVDRRSPLAARVAVNRVWQALFGRGLVETPDDFGTRAPVPEHRELLDWLAVRFMDDGWSLKRLIRTIVTSDTYRQSSAVTDEMLARDPVNRLLSRGARFRVDAEIVRDVALAVSGLLHHRLGGPPVIPPVPQNVLDYNFFYPEYWKPAPPPERYRRSVYLFRKRSMPDPVLASFDAPTGEVACARRICSNTPLAALTGLNEPVFVEAARALAVRVLRETGGGDDARVDHAFRLCTARRPTADERRELLRFLGEQRTRLAEGWLDAQDVATGAADAAPVLPPGATPQDAAAWTLVARVLLNLDETLTRN